MVGGFAAEEFSFKSVRVRDPINTMATIDEDRARYRCRPDPGKHALLFAQNFSSSNPEDFCQQLRFAVHGYQEPGKCLVYDDKGKTVAEFGELKNETAISVVPSPLPYLWQADTIGEVIRIEGGPTEKLVEMEALSIEPRVYKIRNLLTDEEIEAFISFAHTQKMDRSTVGEVLKDAVGQNLGLQDADRTSQNTWDTDSDHAVKIQKRVFDLLRVPYNRDWADGFQILHYEPGQFYNSHEDWFGAEDSVKQNRNFDPSSGGANRFATLFLYLSTVELGGETVFPKAADVEEDMSTRPRGEALRAKLVANGTIRQGGLEWTLFDTCRKKLHTKPVKGEVVLFYNLDTRGVLDVKAQHGACAPLTSDKWGANLWIWNGPYYIDQARTADFVNDLTTEVSAFWEGSEEEVFLDTVAPGTSYQSFTFVGHTFVFRSGTKSWKFTIAEEPEKQAYHMKPNNFHSEL